MESYIYIDIYVSTNNIDRIYKNTNVSIRMFPKRETRGSTTAQLFFVSSGDKQRLHQENTCTKNALMYNAAERISDIYIYI